MNFEGVGCWVVGCVGFWEWVYGGTRVMAYGAGEALLFVGSFASW